MDLILSQTDGDIVCVSQGQLWRSVTDLALSPIDRDTGLRRLYQCAWTSTFSKRTSYSRESSMYIPPFSAHALILGMCPPNYFFAEYSFCALLNSRDFVQILPRTLYECFGRLGDVPRW